MHAPMQISPSITPNVHAYVHHMLVYLCTTPLNASVVGESGSCFDISPEVYECTHGLLISGWAVGGEVWYEYYTFVVNMSPSIMINMHVCELISTCRISFIPRMWPTQLVVRELRYLLSSRFIMIIQNLIQVC